MLLALALSFGVERWKREQFESDAQVVVAAVIVSVILVFMAIAEFVALDVISEPGKPTALEARIVTWALGLGVSVLVGRMVSGGPLERIARSLKPKPRKVVRWIGVAVVAALIICAQVILFD